MKKGGNIIKGGYTYYDTPIGIICLDAKIPRPRGHLRNPLTFDFPIVCKILKGIDVPRLLFNFSDELIEPFINAAKELEQEGVKAIVGSCGFMARYQKNVVEAVKIPVLLSSLLQIPLIRLMHGSDCKIGILTASSSALQKEHFEQLGEDINSVLIHGMESFPEFRETILEKGGSDIDLDILEQEICTAAEKIYIEGDLDALLLECTDLPPFASKIQKIISIPVYDINSLVNFAQYAVCRRKY